MGLTYVDAELAEPSRSKRRESVRFLVDSGAIYSSAPAPVLRRLGIRALRRDEFELATPVSLSICCFRYVPPDLHPASGSEAYLNELNERLMTAIQLDGRAFCSNAVLSGRFVLRACIVNFRTEAQDVDALLDLAAELGARLDGELRPETLGAARS